MNDFYLKKLLKSTNELDNKIKNYMHENLITQLEPDNHEIKGHIAKAEHNIKFVDNIQNEDFLDWVLVGCYYTLYHASLALILKKGFFSKNHDATLCLLIKNYYKNLTDDDINLFNFTFLNKEDILFYVVSKNKRENASYSTKINFDRSQINKVVIKTKLLLNKIKEIIDNLE
jgi:uncharacterized protein (UPF0332 family)